MSEGKVDTPRRSKRRGQEIVDIAARIFNEKGYQATSIQEIAEEVGILKGSLYYYIDTKEDLLFGVIKEAYDAALAMVQELEQKEGTPLELIEDLVRGHVDVFVANRVQSAVFFREFRSLSEERQKTIRDAADVYSGILRTQIQQGQELGEIHADIDPRLATIGIIGMLNAMSFWYRPDGSATAAEIGREFSRLVIGGLRTRP